MRLLRDILNNKNLKINKLHKPNRNRGGISEKNATIFCRRYHKHNKAKSDIEHEKNISDLKKNQKPTKEGTK